jgi:prevent-host-death family protein
MITINIAPAKAKLSKLVNSALKGEDVVLCKNGKPAVRLVPLYPLSEEDPCRIIPGLTINAGDKAISPLGNKDWGNLI